MKMSNEVLNRNMEYVKANFEKLLNLYRNKYILVNEQEVVGSFDNYETAAEEGINAFGLYSGFLVHFISEELPINFLAQAIL
ncbi:MAG: hypothetical protein QG635_1159 [Bacteroidota bacterium]|nr:hypothetical protein [Bacteroidota bacterium]